MIFIRVLPATPRVLIRRGGRLSDFRRDDIFSFRSARHNTRITRVRRSATRRDGAEFTGNRMERPNPRRAVPAQRNPSGYWSGLTVTQQ